MVSGSLDGHTESGVAGELDGVFADQLGLGFLHAEGRSQIAELTGNSLAALERGIVEADRLGDDREERDSVDFVCLGVEFIAKPTDLCFLGGGNLEVVTGGGNESGVELGHGVILMLCVSTLLGPRRRIALISGAATAPDTNEVASMSATVCRLATSLLVLDVRGGRSAIPVIPEPRLTPQWTVRQVL